MELGPPRLDLTLDREAFARELERAAAAGLFARVVSYVPEPLEERLRRERDALARVLLSTAVANVAPDVMRAVELERVRCRALGRDPLLGAP